jgi:hypothetical protein
MAAPPRLDRLVPDSIAVERGMVAEVEIHGRGFAGGEAPPGNTVRVGSVALNAVPSNAQGTVIRFVVPDAVPGGGEAPPSAWLPGRYPVTVTTARGMSDTLYLQIITPRGIRP